MSADRHRAMRERGRQTSRGQTNCFALAPASRIRQFDRHELRLAYHLRATIGIRCGWRGGAANERFQEQEELLSKHGSFLHCLLFVRRTPIWFDELVH